MDSYTSSWEGAEGIQPFSRQRTHKAKDALKQRFESASRQHSFASEFLARRKSRNEGWVDFGEDLRLLADKAFPDLHDDAARDG